MIIGVLGEADADRARGHPGRHRGGLHVRGLPGVGVV